MRNYYGAECHKYVLKYFNKYFEHAMYIDYNEICSPTNVLDTATPHKLRNAIE